MIKFENGNYRYFDKYGVEIIAGSTILYKSGRTEKVYLTDEGRLGTDATNPVWLKNGRAYPCEYGIYPLETGETNEVIVVEGFKVGKEV